MIAKAKSISHGINDILYITGESRNKKHPERIHPVKDNLLPPGLNASGIWDSMRLTLASCKRVRNSVIRLEVSPAPEHTKDFTTSDWQRLWDDFVREFDSIELHDKNGKTYSPKTNLRGSKGTVWLHLESRSGVPHLHGAYCRMDENGCINNDHDIHIRAQRAAERVALKRGWTTAAEVRQTNIGEVNRDCMEALQSMENWSWKEYAAILRSKGYEIWELQDSKDVLRGYVLKKGNARYKASELGRGRNLTASRIEGTWKKLHTASRTRVFPCSRTQGDLLRMQRGQLRSPHKESRCSPHIPNTVPGQPCTVSGMKGTVRVILYPMQHWTCSTMNLTTGRQPTAVTLRTWQWLSLSGCSMSRQSLPEAAEAVQATFPGGDAKTRMNGNGPAVAHVRRQR